MTKVGQSPTSGVALTRSQGLPRNCSAEVKESRPPHRDQSSIYWISFLASCYFSFWQEERSPLLLLVYSTIKKHQIVILSIYARLLKYFRSVVKRLSFMIWDHAFRVRIPALRQKSLDFFGVPGWEGVGKREFPVEEGLGKPWVSQFR